MPKKDRAFYVPPAESKSTSDYGGKIESLCYETGICKGPCLEGFVSYNGICSKYIHEKINWIDAELFCQNLAKGGHLASVHCPLENLFLSALIQISYHHADTMTWIGASDCYKEGTFLWLDGSRMDHSEWYYNQPDDGKQKENCVMMNKNKNGLWFDADCSQEYNFICSYKLSNK
ncbi:lectin-like [Callorhinchus milii]|uniref:lectin-like n=1 Tax=Callorhinchus milii TaxID=7868 RepID=UPI001C3FCD6D|nr:lectin-like [Callorhinchus milii]